MAPPIVTFDDPGETGKKKPKGIITSNNSLIETPPPTVTSLSDNDIPLQKFKLNTKPSFN